jgi:hypothetical protein
MQHIRITRKKNLSEIFSERITVKDLEVGLYRWEGNMKICRIEIGRESLDWIQLALDDV